MIPEINTIIYASDLGEGSKKAFYMAAKEAFRHNAKLIFLTIVEPTKAATLTMLEGYLSPAIIAEMRNEGKENIKKVMESRIADFCHHELADRDPLAHSPVARIEEGDAAESIIKVAEELDADMIVMGTRTRTHSGLGRLFLGSTAQSVMQLSDRPILIVPLKN